MSDALVPPSYASELDRVKERLYALEQVKPAGTDVYPFDVVASWPGGPATGGDSGAHLRSTLWGPKHDCVLVSMRVDVASVSSVDQEVVVIDYDNARQTSITLLAGQRTVMAEVSTFSMTPANRMYIGIPVNGGEDWDRITVHCYFRTNVPIYMSGGLVFEEESGFIG